MNEPIVYDFYCGLGGWAEGFLAEGYRCVGFDIEAHDYGTGGYPGELRLRDARSVHGSECKDAACIVASPPCQEPSYRAMPWSRAKALNAIGPPHNFIDLFNQCFRIQREASEAAGHYIPLIVENVRGAQKWVGRARWNYGSFYLWGDVPALMPLTWKATKTVGHVNIRDGHTHTRHLTNQRESDDSRKVSMNFHEHEKTGKPGRSFQSAAVAEAGLKLRDSDGYERNHPAAFGWKSPRTSSRAVSARKAASAMIAKIPYPLALHIARTFKPRTEAIA